jgi:hypothetical protein
MKQPRKVSLINVADYPRDLYSAYWIISVRGSDEDGYRWQANILSYEPTGWEYQGKVTAERPADAPWPMYPPDVPVKQQQYEKMTPAAQAQVRAAQDVRRAECARIYEAHPKPTCAVAEQIGVADDRDAADTAAQTWVLEQMTLHRRPQVPPEQSGYALALGPYGLFPGPVGMLWDSIGELTRRLFRPLLALAYSSTVRNNMLQTIIDGIDGGAGAGLLRIYDGSRPATCGTATTLLAELTFSDPCGTKTGGVLTMSAITSDSSANATGTASWYRMVDSTGTCVADGNVGTSGSDLNLNSTSISSGVTVAVSSMTITEGNA